MRVGLCLRACFACLLARLWRPPALIRALVLHMVCAYRYRCLLTSRPEGMGKLLEDFIDKKQKQAFDPHRGEAEVFVRNLCNSNLCRRVATPFFPLVM